MKKLELTLGCEQARLTSLSDFLGDELTRCRYAFASSLLMVRFLDRYSNSNRALLCRSYVDLLRGVNVPRSRARLPLLIRARPFFRSYSAYLLDFDFPVLWGLAW
jgi:hypothetical protein